jgi:hypothetical protein
MVSLSLLEFEGLSSPSLPTTLLPGAMKAFRIPHYEPQDYEN